MLERLGIGFDQLDPRILPDMGVKVSFLTERAPAETAGSPGRVIARKVSGRMVSRLTLIRSSPAAARASAVRDRPRALVVIEAEDGRASPDSVGRARGKQVPVSAGAFVRVVLGSIGGREGVKGLF